MIELWNGECLEKMQDIPDKSIDTVICDPPYGTTNCKWDTIIPFDEMWTQLERITKVNSPIVLFGSEPFSSFLRISNIKNYKYDWVWKKSKAMNFQQAKNSPLKRHENIIVFSRGTVGHKIQTKKRMTYNPQGTNKCDKWVQRETSNDPHNLKRKNGHEKGFKQTTENYPDSLLHYGSVHNPPHPTQKPVELMEYLVKTYSDENDVVLDFTMGSGTTAIACVNTNRSFIGIELDKNYFKLAKDRIDKRITEKTIEEMFNV